VLDAAELQGGMAKTTMGGFIKLHSKELDENGDGKITKAEMLSVSGMLFDKSDKNRDGRLTADEPSGGRKGEPKKAEGL